MRLVADVLAQVRDEQRAFWRNPPAAVFTFLFTILFLVFFSIIYAHRSVEPIPGRHLRFVQYYVPAIMVFGVISSCFTGLAYTLTARRDSGVLKRIRGTPLPTAVYFAGLVGSSIVNSVVILIVTVAFGRLAYQVPLPAHWPALVVILMAGTACFSLLGIAGTALVPNAEAATAVLNGILWPLLFISGTFYVFDPRSLLERIAGVLPVRPFTLGTLAAMDPAHANRTGFAPADLLVVGIWGAAALVFSLRRFRWTPERRGRRRQ